MDLGDGNHHRTQRIRLARRNRLQRHDHLRGGKNRIDTFVRLCRMAAPPCDLDVELISGRHDRSPAGGKCADCHAGMIVHAVDLPDSEILHHAIGNHFARTATALFRRLEDDRDGTAKIARLGKVFGRSQQHRGVPVMAAGMHLARRFRGPGLAGHLVDRQRIHVGAQADHGTIAAIALDDADDAGPADPGLHHITAEFIELRGHEGRRAMHIEQQFGILMQMTAPLSDFRLKFTGAVEHWHE